MSLLEVNNVSFTYSKNSILSVDTVKNISFSLKSGEIIGVIGHTGSGKSTLMQILNGLITPDEGTVLFKGENIFADKKKLPKYRFNIGLVFQYPEYQLFEETCYKDIAFGPKNMGLKDAEIDASVKSSINAVSLSVSYLERSPFDLSGGEKRKVAIAGVIAMKPEVLILDEPTAGLDPIGRENLIKFIDNYRKSTGAGIIIVSHSMEDMAKISDKLLVLKEGNLVVFDKTENVFSDYESLLNAGLKLPVSAWIYNELIKDGLVKPKNVYTVETAANSIYSALKEGGKNA